MVEPEPEPVVEEEVEPEADPARERRLQDEGDRDNEACIFPHRDGPDPRLRAQR